MEIPSVDNLDPATAETFGYVNKTPCFALLLLPLCAYQLLQSGTTGTDGSGPPKLQKCV